MQDGEQGVDLVLADGGLTGSRDLAVLAVSDELVLEHREGERLEEVVDDASAPRWLGCPPPPAAATSRPDDSRYTGLGTGNSADFTPPVSGGPAESMALTFRVPRRQRAWIAVRCG